MKWNGSIDNIHKSVWDTFHLTSNDALKTQRQLRLRTFRKVWNRFILSLILLFYFSCKKLPTNLGFDLGLIFTNDQKWLLLHLWKQRADNSILPEVWAWLLEHTLIYCNLKLPTGSTQFRSETLKLHEDSKKHKTKHDLKHPSWLPERVGTKFKSQLTLKKKNGLNVNPTYANPTSPVPSL